MTRANLGQFYQFDPELERNLRKSRRRLELGCSTEGASSSSEPTIDSVPLESPPMINISSDPSPEPEIQEDRMEERTIREMVAPDATITQNMCIQYPDGECELKSGLIHLLPKFHALEGEDPYHHLKEFLVVCSSMRPTTVTEEHIKLKVFPFSLQDVAKNWLYCLPPGSINTWETLNRLFLEKFFPTSRVDVIRKDIYRIRQPERESIHEYCERFKNLCVSCPHHQINEHPLIQYFYEGLSIIDRQMIDAASGGALVDKTPKNARELIENMASNHQKFTTKSNSTTLVKGIHGVEASYLANNKKIQGKLDDLAAMVRTLADL